MFVYSLDVLVLEDLRDRIMIEKYNINVTLHVTYQ